MRSNSKNLLILIMSQSTKNTVANIIGIVLGLLFIFSAWTKTFPISSFEYTIYSQLGFSKIISSYLARIVIGIEYGLGTLLLLHFLLKRKWVIIANILLLIGFTIHLLILYIQVGNDVNCGCMGDVVKMAPLPSIGKNIIIGILLLLQLTWTKSFAKIKLSNAWLVLFILACVATLFVAFPLKPQPSHLSYHKLYSAEQPEQPKVDLLKGKHIVSFMTLGCGHCRDAAKEFATIQSEYPDLPLYFIFLQPDDTTSLGDKKNDFFFDTKIEHLPHHFIKAATFIEMVEESGNAGTPVILWMQDSSIIREIPNGSIDGQEMNAWLQSK